MCKNTYVDENNLSSCTHLKKSMCLNKNLVKIVYIHLRLSIRY